MSTKAKFAYLSQAILLMVAVAGCAATPTSEGTGGYVDDSAITTKVKFALLNKGGVDSSEITVETFKGVVQLSGFLDSQSMINSAVDTARQVGGVKSVTNNLVVKGNQGSD